MNRPRKQPTYLKNKKMVRPALFIFIAVLAISLTLSYYATETRNRAGQEHPPAASIDDHKNLGQEEEASVYKNETVYILLDHAGNVLDQQIVNWIYQSGNPEAKIIADYGRYSSVNNMISGEKPILENDRVLWDSALLNAGDIYYEGATDKKLPVEFKIEYFLDGEAFNAPALAGKSGRLEIVITAKNNLVVQDPVIYRDYNGNAAQTADVNYVPLLVQGTYMVDLNRYSNVQAENAAMIITGQTMSLNFMAFPYPEAEIIISMDGEDIELNNIMLIMIPQLPPIPDVEDMEDGLVEMLEGLSAIGEGLARLHDGTGQLLEGLERFRDESNSMMAGFDQLAAFLAEYEHYLDELLSFFDQPRQEELTEMIQLLRELLEDMGALPDPGIITANIRLVSTKSGQLENAQADLSRDTEALTATNARVVAEAEKLISENEAGSELYELGILLLEQNEQFNQIAAGNRSLEQEAKELRTAVTGLNTVWDNNYLTDLDALQDTTRDMAEWLELLPDYLIILEELLDFAENADHLLILFATVEEMFEELSALPQALEQMVEGQRQLKDGLNEINEQGIQQLIEGIVEGINEVRFGEAKIELMRALAEDYRSHADNEHNRNSNIQFILQTEKIEKPEVEHQNDPPQNIEENRARTMWLRFLALFDWVRG